MVIGAIRLDQNASAFVKVGSLVKSVLLSMFIVTVKIDQNASAFVKIGSLW